MVQEPFFDLGLRKSHKHERQRYDPCGWMGVLFRKFTWRQKWPSIFILFMFVASKNSYKNSSAFFDIDISEHYFQNSEFNFEISQKLNFHIWSIDFTSICNIDFIVFSKFMLSGRLRMARRNSKWGFKVRGDRLILFNFMK